MVSATIKNRRSPIAGAQAASAGEWGFDVQHVLLVLGSGDGEGLVEVGRRGNVDGVNVGVTQQLLVAAVGLGDPLLLAPFCRGTKSK